jgi:hypothetical protein
VLQCVQFDNKSIQFVCIKEWQMCSINEYTIWYKSIQIVCKKSANYDLQTSVKVVVKKYTICINKRVWIVFYKQV